jgi:hypothetical protein
MEVAGKTFDIRTYFEEEKYIISITLNNLVEKIKVDRESYRSIYSDLLGKKHSNIVNFLKFDGKLFQL